jgi:hypothetical protein
MPSGVYPRRNIHPTADRRTMDGKRWHFKRRLLLTQEDKDNIIADRKSGMSLGKVAKKHGISTGTVCKIINGKGWNPNRQPPKYLNDK